MNGRNLFAEIVEGFDALAAERRGAEKHQAKEHLEALLLDGLRGEMEPLTADDFRAIRQKAMTKLKVPKAKR